ncbi:uncharacterized protein MONBRDRAFT_29148 [Monosiga brevicollis MX1]|uniref:Uncharacterized protein n=1 Tax=Monosiga brevicollis TaxID=81824 RepID=A9VA93_MONBE|nr:uncharacterized protein MONBRDRAFT_29148 [Monosiga brevicollis MX1]EDQ85446.1 predicted protein [Monosiga brevicollis MX1]|eukprot:XP_001749637.1 hypothetical protein [Monosiga brevicollis MX1]
MFGVSLNQLMLAADEAAPTLPHGLVYLCEHLHDGAVVSDKLSKTSAHSIYAIVEADVSETSLEDGRRAVEGQYDLTNAAASAPSAPPPEVCYHLLRAFVRELPHSIVPEAMFRKAIDLATAHAASCLSSIRQHPGYEAFVSEYMRDEMSASSLSAWLRNDEAVLVGNYEDRSWLSNTEKASRRQLRELFSRSLLRLTTPGISDALHELFFAIPSPRRRVLEYLMTVLARIDLVYTRGLDEDGAAELPSSLMPVFAEDLAVYLIRPMHHKKGQTSVERRLQQQYQVICFLIFATFIKRKQNLLSTSERDQLEWSNEKHLEHEFGQLINMSASTPRLRSSRQRQPSTSSSQSLPTLQLERPSSHNQLPRAPSSSSITKSPASNHVDASLETRSSTHHTVDLIEHSDHVCETLVMRAPHAPVQPIPLPHELDYFALCQLSGLDRTCPPATNESAPSLKAPGAGLGHLLHDQVDLDSSRAFHDVTKANLLEAPIMEAINFDYAHALFPRTIDLRATQEAVPTSARKWILGAAQQHKEAFPFDQDDRFMRMTCLLPSYVLKKGNFKPHVVCQPCERHVRACMDDLVLNVAEFSDRALKVFGTNLVETLAGCPSCDQLLAMMPADLMHYAVLFEERPFLRISFRHLLQMPQMDVTTRLSAFVDVLESHVQRIDSKLDISGIDELETTLEEEEESTSVEAGHAQKLAASLSHPLPADLDLGLLPPPEAGYGSITICCRCKRPAHAGCTRDHVCLACHAHSLQDTVLSPESSKAELLYLSADADYFSFG